MFIDNSKLWGRISNDSEEFLIQDSLLSGIGGMFIQMDEKGYLNKGSMHVKATLEKDHHKSFLIQILEDDTIKSLKKKIGELMELHYDSFRGLRHLQASKIIQRNNNVSNAVVHDDDLVKNVCVDGEEIFFELESYDLWLQVAFHLYHKERLMIYGVTEMRIEKQETIKNLKKKLQKVAYDMWSKALKSDNYLYVVDQFDLKTVEEDVPPQFLVQSINSERNTPSYTQLNGGPIDPFAKMSVKTPQSVQPLRQFSPNRKMFDLKRLRKFQDCTVGEIFGYKNRLFMKIVFRALLRSNVHKRIHPVVIIRNQNKLNESNQSIQSHFSADSVASDDDFFDNMGSKPLPGAKTQTTRNSASNFLETHKLSTFPAFDIVQRLTGKNSEGNFKNTDNSGIQLPVIKRNNQSEDIKIHSPNLELEQALLSKITYGVVIVNSDRNKDVFEKIMSLLNDRYLEQQRKLEEERFERMKRELELQELQIRSLTQLVKKNKGLNVLQTPGQILPSRLNSVHPKKTSNKFLKWFKHPKLTKANRSQSFIKIEDQRFGISSENSPEQLQYKKPKGDQFEEEQELVEASISSEFALSVKDENINFRISNNILISNNYSPPFKNSQALYTEEDQEEIIEIKEDIHENMNDVNDMNIENEDSLQLIGENIENQDINKMLQSFVVTIEEIYLIKEPKFRNLKMQSQLKNFVKQNEEGAFDEAFNPDIFFDSILLIKEFEHQEKEKKKKKKKDKKIQGILETLCVTVGIIAVLVVVVILINPFGIKDWVLSVFWTVWNFIVRNEVEIIEDIDKAQEFVLKQ